MKEKWRAILIPIPKETWNAYSKVKVDLSPENIVSGEEGYFITIKSQFIKRTE